MAKGPVAKVILGLLSLLKVGLTTAIIIIVAVHLYDVRVYTSDRQFSWQTSCLMAGSVNNGDVCEYTYAVCGLSLLLSLVASLFLCITCDLCGLGAWLEFAVEGFQTAWWVIASIVISKKVRDSNELLLSDGSHLPKENWRDAVAVMAWVTALLCAIAAVMLLFQCLKSLAECCGCCGGKGKKADREGRKDEEDAPQPVDYGATGQQQGGPQPQPYTAPSGNDQAVRANAV